MFMYLTVKQAVTSDDGVQSEKEIKISKEIKTLEELGHQLEMLELRCCGEFVDEVE